MSMLRRILVTLATVGWLAPLCLSYWATYDFLWNVVWPAAAFDKPYMSPWHPFSFADELFYFSMLWLAAVLVGWSIFLTGRDRGG
jgi:hypothetical protein